MARLTAYFEARVVHRVDPVGPACGDSDPTRPALLAGMEVVVSPRSLWHVDGRRNPHSFPLPRFGFCLLTRDPPSKEGGGLSYPDPLC